MVISQVAQKFNISQDTLRYYEKEGLIGPISKENGIRNYTENDINRIEFVKCMRSAGVEIKVLRKYLELFKSGEDTLEQRRDILINQQDILAEKIEKMTSAYNKLKYKIKLYDAKLLESKLK